MRSFIFFGCVVLAVCAFGLVDSTLQAQPYPNRPIQLIIPMGPGTGTDINGRILVEELKKILKTEIFVVNKPGASQTTGTDFVVKSKKDGYTLLYAGGAAIIAKAIEPETVPYDPIRDLEPLGLHAFFPVVIAVPENAPWKSFHEFLNDAKKNPGKIRVSSPGIQTHSSFNLVIIETLSGAKLTQVPFKEGMAAVTNMLGGNVEATCISMSMVIPFANSGKAKILLTSKKMAEFPNIPTLNELGFKQELPSPWFAMYAPAGIPEEVKKVLVPALKEAIHNPDVTAKISKIGGSVIDYKSPEELRKTTIEELETISAIAIKIGLRK
jgi:tripartite-type tricarboxylate transporter receptor subunit TctC